MLSKRYVALILAIIAFCTAFFLLWFPRQASRYDLKTSVHSVREVVGL